MIILGVLMIILFCAIMTPLLSLFIGVCSFLMVFGDVIIIAVIIYFILRKIFK